MLFIPETRRTQEIINPVISALALTWVNVNIILLLKRIYNVIHITDPSEILLEQQHFYKTLYSSRNINDYDESFFNHVPNSNFLCTKEA
jgi:hypothetical protein